MGLFKKNNKKEMKKDLAGDFLKFKKSSNDDGSEVDEKEHYEDVKFLKVKKIIDDLKDENELEKKKEEDDRKVKENLFANYQYNRRLEDEKFISDYLYRKKKLQDLKKQIEEYNMKNGTNYDYSNIKPTLFELLNSKPNIAAKMNSDTLNMLRIRLNRPTLKNSDLTKKEVIQKLISTPVFYDPKSLAILFDKVKDDVDSLHLIIKERSSRTLKNLRKNKMTFTRGDRFMLMTDLDIISRACARGLNPELVVMEKQFNKNKAFDRVVTLNEYLDDVANFLASKNKIDFVKRIDDILVAKDVEDDILAKVNNPMGQLRKVKKLIQEKQKSKENLTADQNNDKKEEKDNKEKNEKESKKEQEVKKDDLKQVNDDEVSKSDSTINSGLGSEIIKKVLDKSNSFNKE